MGLSPIEQQVLKRWKSVRRLVRFLERELKGINRECFGDKLSLPTIQLLRMKYCRDLLSGGYVGAYYRPSHGNLPAEIGIYPLVLTDAREARIALAHEMVHHWEWQHRHTAAGYVCPAKAHYFVRRQFPEPEQKYQWRLSHSFQFLGKASEVAEKLGISLREFLFKNLG